MWERRLNNLFDIRFRMHRHLTLEVGSGAPMTMQNLPVVCGDNMLRVVAVQCLADANTKEGHPDAAVNEPYLREREAHTHARGDNPTKLTRLRPVHILP